VGLRTPAVVRLEGALAHVGLRLSYARGGKRPTWKSKDRHPPYQGAAARPEQGTRGAGSGQRPGAGVTCPLC
jgi:hypothetical protein